MEGQGVVGRLGLPISSSPSGDPHQELLGSVPAALLQRGGTSPAEPPHLQGCWNRALEDWGTDY